MKKVLIVLTLLTVFGFKTNYLSGQSAGKTEVPDSEPTKIAVEDFKHGDKLLGLKVTEYRYNSKTDFYFKLKGKKVLKGVLTRQDVLVFSPESTSNQNGILVVNGHDKPFFMWIRFKNEEELLKQLSEEQKTIILNHESIEITLQIKDYEVGTIGYDLFVLSRFVKIIK